MFADLARLFSTPLRIKLLKFFALQPDEKFVARTIAPVVGTSRLALQSELAALTRLGVVGARAGKDGRQYGWNRTHPLAPQIQSFVAETTMPEDKTIAELFRPLGVHLVIAAGVFADETRSTLDLLVVTRRPKDPRIATIVKKLERLSAMPIRYAVMEVGEYHTRIQAYDRLLRDIMDFRHRVILGRTMAA